MAEEESGIETGPEPQPEKVDVAVEAPAQVAVSGVLQSAGAAGAAPEQVMIGNVPTMQTVVQPYGQVLMVGPPSGSAKVIGVLGIIAGGFSLLGMLGGFLPQQDPMTGEELVVPGAVIAINAVNSLISAVAFGLGGWWLLNYERRGIHLMWAGLVAGFVLSIVSVLAGGDGGLSSIFGEGAALGIISGFTLICNGICAVIIAIPLMISNHGLDDSKLFG